MQYRMAVLKNAGMKNVEQDYRGRNAGKEM